MNYKILLILLFLFSCATPVQVKKEVKVQKIFSNKGFALLYNENLTSSKKVTKTIEDRSLIIFQKNLEEDSIVKITNLLNNKYLIAKVGPISDYPDFYNSVISKRIFDKLEMDPQQPYLEITTVNDSGETFIAKKAKTFEEEKKVADKAPVEGITINNLNEQKKTKKITKKKIEKNFIYIIKIGDFYFKDTANLMIKRIKKDTKIKNVQIMNVSNTQYRVFIGPFKNLKSLKKGFNDISIINFENLEIIKQ